MSTKINKFLVFNMRGNKILEEDLEFFVEQFPFEKEIAGKTFLITGATGLIGSIMINSLLRLNEKRNTKIKIIALARNKAKAKESFGDSPISWVFQDLKQRLEIPDQKIDYIIHLASPTSSKFFVEHPVETLRSIVEGTVSILELAKETGVCSMVYASSLEVYGTSTDDGLIGEDFQGYVSLSDTRSSYNIGKRTAESLCLSYSMEYRVPVKIARLTQTFGAGVEFNDGRVFAQFARRIIERKDIELHSSGETGRMYCYTIDAIMAIFYLLLKGKDGDAYNIANPDTYITIRDMAQFLAREFGDNTGVETQFRTDLGYAPTTKLKLNISKLESLGWKPYFSLEQMFERLIGDLSLSIQINKPK